MTLEKYDSNNERFARQIPLVGFGSEGQQRVIDSKVLVVGAGGLGSPIITYLAGCGVGTIGICDGDNVEVTNLHRQVIHDMSWVGKPKAVSATARVNSLNPNTKVKTYVLRLTADNAEEIIKDYDFVVSAVDNFKSKFLINDACVLLGKPFSHCGVVAWSGQVFTHKPNGPCLRCFLPGPPPAELAPTCVKVGLLGPGAGIMGCLQSLEILKYLGQSTDDLHCLTDRLMKVDLLTLKTSHLSVEKDAHCPVCGKNPTITSIKDVEIPVIG